MEHIELKSAVEALIFVAEEPMTVNALALIFGEAGVDKAAIRQAIETLQEEYAQRPGGIELREVAGGFQIRTRASVAAWVQRLNVPKPTRLSQPAMETLAIVAYRQPIVRAEVEEIRGVDCGGVLKTLLERNVIQIVGKRDDPGSPLLYGTTKEFLSLFNLENLSALPTLRDFQALEQPAHVSVAEGGGAPEAPDAYNPMQIIAPEVQVAMDVEDQEVIGELEEQLRSLRHMERHLFPDEPELTDVADATESVPHTDETVDAHS